MSISLNVDYSNGAGKWFAKIAFHTGMTILDVLEAARSIPPGLQFDFNRAFTDRGGREVGSITSVDGVHTKDSKLEWQIWVNSEPVEELRQPTPGMPATGDIVKVADGDCVSLKLTSKIRKATA